MVYNVHSTHGHTCNFSSDLDKWIFEIFLCDAIKLLLFILTIYVQRTNMNKHEIPIAAGALNSNGDYGNRHQKKR